MPRFKKWKDFILTSCLQRDFKLKKAEFDIQVQTQKATSELAYELQAAKTKQKIKNEEIGIKVG